MKKSLYIMALCATMLASSCSSDYLDTTPDASLSKKVTFSTTEHVEQAVNGLSKMMTQQYFGNRYFNGEGTIKSFYGNLQGNDYQKYYSALKDIANGTHMVNSARNYDYFPWFYYYRIIGNANSIILHVDEATGTEAKKQFLKAQALTFRAYCYSMLVQLYSNRWKDHQGDAKGVVLRLDESTGDMPLSTLGKCYEQMYADLDQAISLFTESKLTRNSSQNYLPDLSVAYAVYARVALNREDWPTAAKYAALARANYPLMSNSEYQSGFNTANKEWIWSVYSSESESLYYFQYYVYEASNSDQAWSTSRPSAISKELYDQIPATDIRRDLFLDPKDDTYNTTTGRATNALTTRAKKEYATKMCSNSLIFAYMQYKQLTKAQPGVGEFNLFRASEMYLIEAEADCHIPGKEAEAQNLLIKLNKDSGRNPEYTCTKTGEDLLEEVRLYNRIELWGEGHDWFNYKRWGLPIIRKGFNKGGSFIAAFAVTINPTDINNWTWVIPEIETDYNKALSN